MLGYYTSNTRWDGRPRKLTVRLKSTGQTIRARREYRAPTEAEMAALRDARTAASSASARALADRHGPERVVAAQSPGPPSTPTARTSRQARLRSSPRSRPPRSKPDDWKQGADVQITLTPKGGQAITAAGRIEPGARGTMVRVPVAADSGPWQAVVRLKGEDNATESGTLSIERTGGTVLGRPIVYRAASAAAAALRPAAAFSFRRTERLRVEWPLRAGRRLAAGAAARPQREAARRADDGHRRARPAARRR